MLLSSGSEVDEEEDEEEDEDGWVEREEEDEDDDEEEEEKGWVEHCRLLNRGNRTRLLRRARCLLPATIADSILAIHRS